MKPADDLTPRTAVNRLVSELAAVKCLARTYRTEGMIEDSITRSSQTIVCIAALMEHGDGLLLEVAIEEVPFDDYFPDFLGDYITVITDIIFAMTPVIEKFAGAFGLTPEDVA